MVLVALSSHTSKGWGKNRFMADNETLTLHLSMFLINVSIQRLFSRDVLLLLCHANATQW